MAGPASKTVRFFNVLQGDCAHWAKTVGVMPLATEMAGVNMRLEVGAVRLVFSSHDAVNPRLMDLTANCTGTRRLRSVLIWTECTQPL